jgi:hypothetical protein
MRWAIPPAVPEGIGDLPVALAPECVVQRLAYFCAVIERALPGSLGIGGGEMEHGCGPTDAERGEDAEIRKLIRQHDLCIAEPELELHQLAAGHLKPTAFLGAEHGAVPLGRARGLTTMCGVTVLIRQDAVAPASRGCFAREAVPFHHALVVEAHESDHVFDVFVGLDSAGTEARPAREDRVVVDAPALEQGVPDLLGKAEMGGVLPVQVTDLSSAHLERELAAPSGTGCDTRPGGDLRGDPLARPLFVRHGCLPETLAPLSERQY